MSNETIKNYGKSIRSKLLNISKKEDVFHQTILTRFFQERLLYRMSQTSVRCIRCVRYIIKVIREYSFKLTI